ncbi:Erythromycin 3''-O-methyltransferase [Paenibacillus polymyxa]|uniref:class I SAM-dependent methyltransferase n=1 Tax=Paenibacillus polymyxa TaxID=1406 RepID=UPI0009475F00|nr:class I SAM-dependent methyltransferase [Paenibacillus polymyxa]APQ60470.1 methyltransferase type 11 [Paenibacillus polymyxa]VUG05308.1 Erythromycin 3''-O-methyltransferase [Paenibacillus polymyxa]
MANVSNYYESIDEDSRFSRNSRKIEFLTTNHVLKNIIPENAYILDVGAGAGAYSFYYAERNHKVVAIDLTPKHIEVIKEKSKQTGMSIDAHVDNAIDLSRFDSETFDFVLCFGPMYHITGLDDRSACIKECLRVLKKGGHLAIAYINKYSVMPMLATRDQKFIRNSVIEKVINEGVIIEGDEDCFWTDAYFTSPNEIEALLRKFDVIPIDHVGTDGISHTIQDYVDRLGDDEFDSWLSYHFQTCREQSILGISTHGLYICQKG